MATLVLKVEGEQWLLGRWRSAHPALWGALGLALVLLGGCGPYRTCETTQVARFEVANETFAVPVSLRPQIWDDPKHEFVRAPPGGGRLYCQGPEDPPRRTHGFILMPELWTLAPRHPGVARLVSLQVLDSAPAGPYKPLPANSPEQSGFIVSTHSKSAMLYSPAHRVRPTPIYAICTGSTVDGLCRIYATWRGSVRISIDLKTTDYPISTWSGVLSDVDKVLDEFSRPQHHNPHMAETPNARFRASG